MLGALSGAVLLYCTPYAVDGDTVHCGQEKIRLLGIDSPELKGHCAEGRHCVVGDALAAKASMAEAIKKKPLQLIRVTTDRYGRTVGSLIADGQDLSCLQLKTGNAIYKPKWDTGGLTALHCPAIVERAPKG